MAALVNLRTLKLDHNNLSGGIPFGIDALQSLEVLDLSYNELEGQIEMHLFPFLNLYWLNLSHNRFTGPISPLIKNAGQLRMLSLAFNHFSGQIPDELGELKNLQHLYLNNNDFTGYIPLGLCGASKLAYLYAGDNIGLRGSQMPDCITGLHELQELSLVNDRLEGPIPARIGDLGNLRILNLGENNFSGRVPASIAQLSNLTHLDLSGNLRPAWPAWEQDIVKLKQLRVLDLEHGVAIQGLPPELSQLEHLQVLKLSSNHLNDDIPPELGQLKELTWLDLDYCGLTGRLPAELGNLSKLEYLNLANNQIVGELPDSLRNLRGLRWLHLDRFWHNQDWYHSDDTGLYGDLGDWIGDLSSLEVLTLSFNHFRGGLPNTLGRLKKLRELHLSYNHFEYYGEWPQLDTLCGMVELRSLALHVNQHLEFMLPRCLMELTRLELLLTYGTLICEPGDREFQAWLQSLPVVKTTGVKCTAPPVSRAISPSGGTLTSAGDATTYTFPPGAFGPAMQAASLPVAGGTVTVTHTMLQAADVPGTAPLAGIRHFYTVAAVDELGRSVQPQLPYTVTIWYSRIDLGRVLPETLALYAWDGVAWRQESTSRVELASQTLTAMPNHFSFWAVLGRTPGVYLPLIMRR